ncbi:hypothetical protein HDV62DRAFT_383931 [Trichoderma sp. SZMC 28011]
MQGRQRCHDVVPSYKGAICLRQTKSLQPLKTTLPVPETRSQIKINPNNAVVMALKLPVPSCNNSQTHCRRLIPTLLRSLLAGHWSAFGFPSSCTLDHARKYLQQPAYCGGWLARLLTVNTERSLHVPRPPSYCFLGEHRLSLLALVLSQWRMIEPVLYKQLPWLIWLYNA